MKEEENNNKKQDKPRDLLKDILSEPSIYGVERRRKDKKEIENTITKLKEDIKKAPTPKEKELIKKKIEFNEWYIKEDIDKQLRDNYLPAELAIKFHKYPEDKKRKYNELVDLLPKTAIEFRDQINSKRKVWEEAIKKIDKIWEEVESIKLLPEDKKSLELIIRNNILKVWIKSQDKLKKAEEKIKKLEEKEEKTQALQLQREKFFNCIFAEYFKSHKGYIEIREVNQRVRQQFFNSAPDLLNKFSQFLGNVYFGVCPREEKKGDSTTIKYISALWIDIDIAGQGHKKKSIYATKEEALSGVEKLKPVPSIIVDSGNGLHLYWLLDKVYSLETKEERQKIELILSGLIRETGGDNIGDFPRVMRVPQTWNIKERTKAKPCDIIRISEDLKYSLANFERYEKQGEKKPYGEYIAKFSEEREIIDLSILSPETQDSIRNGDIQGQYMSRSERDQAVIYSLVQQGFYDNQIREIFSNPDNAISDKYLESRNGDHYLSFSIRKARIYKPRSLSWLPVPLELDNELDKSFRTGKGIFSFFKDYETSPEGDFIFSIKNIEGIQGKELRYIIPGNEFRQLKEKYKIHPDIRIITKYMDEAYLTSLKEAIERKNPFISIKLKDKYETLGKQGRPSRQEERERLLAEDLLYSVNYIRTEIIEGEKDIIKKRRFYSAIDIIQTKGSPTRLNIGLALEHLRGFPLDLKRLKEWTEAGERIKPYQLPFGISRQSGKYAEYKHKTVEHIKKYFRGRSPSISYSIEKFFNDIEVSKKIKSRKKESRELWNILKPIFEDRGFKAEPERLKDSGDSEDIRKWIIRLGLPEKKPGA